MVSRCISVSEHGVYYYGIPQSFGYWIISELISSTIKFGGILFPDKPSTDRYINHYKPTEFMGAPFPSPEYF
jgi:hypothetical protein